MSMYSRVSARSITAATISIFLVTTTASWALDKKPVVAPKPDPVVKNQPVVDRPDGDIHDTPLWPKPKKIRRSRVEVKRGTAAPTGFVTSDDSCLVGKFETCD